MRVIGYIALSLALFTLIITSSAYAAGRWLITFANGETLSANDCAVEDGGLHVYYPVGDAYIPIGSVASVIRDGAPVELLQSEGEQLSHTSENSPAPQYIISSVTTNSPDTPLTSTNATDKGTGTLPDPGFGFGQIRMRHILGLRGSQASAAGAADVIDMSKRWPYGQSYEAYEIVSQADYIDDDELNLRLDALFPEFADDIGVDD